MYEKIILSNGVRIVYEHISHVRSAAVGVWVGVGSRHERAAENGAAHFIEHMLFKGTQTRSAAAIAEEMDAVGGQLDALTSKECTVFLAQTLDSHLDTAIDVLTDMLFCSRFDERDVEVERDVILEEIGMYADNPEDLVVERLFDLVYAGSPLGRRVLGTRRTLRTLDAAALKAFHAAHYTPDRIVVALSGCFEDRHIQRLEQLFSPLSGPRAGKTRPAVFHAGITLRRRATEQNHLCLAFPSVGYHDPDRYTLQLISGILGHGMSSRLFQQVREQHGLCYSIDSFGVSHAETGVFAVYTALSAEMEQQALLLILEQLRRFRREGATQAELDRAREQAKASMLMGMESTSARMSLLGRNELLRGTIPTAEEIIQAYDAVTLEQLSRAAARLLDFDAAALSVVGRVQSEEFYGEMIRHGSTQTGAAAD